MKKNLIPQLIFLMLFFSCVQSQNSDSQGSGPLGKKDRLNNSHKKVPEHLQSVSGCISKDPAYSAADFFQSFEDGAVEASGVSVSYSEINQFGDEAYDEMKKSGDYKFITSGEKLSALQKMLSELLRTRRDPSGIKYEIHLINDKTINAYTVGGHIIVTTGIIEEAESESAMAFIIGHEIGHNEKGHITKTIKKLKIADGVVKGVGNIGIAMQQMITPAFNQPNEVEADFYGIDLSYAAGYNPKKGIDFWRSMSKKENKNMIASFLRSHPFSEDRAKCMEKYIKKNYNF